MPRIPHPCFTPHNAPFVYIVPQHLLPVKRAPLLTGQTDYGIFQISVPQVADRGGGLHGASTATRGGNITLSTGQSTLCSITNDDWLSIYYPLMLKDYGP